MTFEPKYFTPNLCSSQESNQRRNSKETNDFLFLLFFFSILPSRSYLFHNLPSTCTAGTETQFVFYSSKPRLSGNKAVELRLGKLMSGSLAHGWPEFLKSAKREPARGLTDHFLGGTGPTHSPRVSRPPQVGPLWVPSLQEAGRISSTLHTRVHLAQSSEQQPLPALLRKQSGHCPLGRAGGLGVQHAWPIAWLSGLCQPCDPGQLSRLSGLQLLYLKDGDNYFL